MEISNEDKLILNSEMFLTTRKYMRQNKPSDEIIAKIEELLKEGADINACDNNDNNNTVLHLAAIKGDKDIILYLLQKGARVSRNRHKKTALDLVLQTNPVLGKDIAEIFNPKEKGGVQSTANKAASQQVKSKPKLQKNNKMITTTPDCNQEITYAKRSGTSGVSGQFYETKLLSLVLHRALHDQEIENFYLAANISNIGDFDDVCFRYNNVACFMQTKHRENVQKAKLRVENVRSTTGKLGLGIYFESFLKIRDRFSSKDNDPMFHGKFEDIDVYFIFYTPLQQEFERKLSGNKQMCNKLHEIIYTGDKELKDTANSEDVFQFDYEERDLDLLTTFIKSKDIKILGTEFLKFVLSNKPIQDIWTIPLMKIYHPALAQKVVALSKNIEGSYNSEQNNASNDFFTGRFRPEFFKSMDPNLIALKETLLQEIVYTHSSKTRLSNKELKRAIKDIAENPCPETISTIIGCPIKFDENNDKLSLDIKKIQANKYTPDEIQEIKYDLQKIQVTRAMVRHAVYISGQKKLENLSFQLSPIFGNTDLKTNKKTEKDEHDRLDILADRLYSLINHFAERNKGNKTKVIDLSSDVVGSGKILEVSHLDSNGGIGGAVGNLLKFDTQNKLLTFNTKGLLGKNAKYLLRKLKEMTGEDMTNYKINVLIEGFPRDTFETYEYDKSIAAQFLSKLWFYTNQAQEESVETTLKKEINIHYNADKQLFHVHSDAIFLRFHDEIQKWWKKQTNASYLTKMTTIFDNAKRDIVDNPLLTVLNVMFVRKVKNIAIDFKVDAIDCLKLDEFTINGKNQILNIVSDAAVLSAAKIMQSKKYTNNYSFISLDYVNILPDEDRKTMIKELKLAKDMTLVLISETSLAQSLQDTLLEILDHFKCLASPKNQIIVITDKPIQNLSDKICVHDYNVVKLNDSNVNLLDLTAQSQTAILEKYSVIYQGQKVTLNLLLKNSMELINGKLLMSLLNKDKIEVGQTFDTRKYDEIKNCYINRNLKRNDEEYAIGTLDDIADKIVLISSQPCMGKTILLTHLSLETKKVDPTPWIVTVNLSVHDKYIIGLRHSHDMNAIMTFLCKAALINCDELKKGYFTNIDKGKIAFHHNEFEDISFELQLFIHSYNSGNIIFLFDGFDKIYPQNTDEGFKVFTAIEEANKRMWITSDCYVIKVLEDKFGTPYKLGRLATVQQKSFLERFWSTNIQLEKLNHDQFNNITLLINFIRRSFNYGSLEDSEDDRGRSVVPFLSVPLHILYITLLEYFKNETHSLSSCYIRELIKKKWRLNSFTRLDRYLRTSGSEKISKLTGTPLHMYIAANYFKFQVTDRFDLHLNTNIIRERSGIYLDAISLYEQFLKVNIKHICEIENKNDEDRYREQDKVRDAFYESHKKLALYAIFQESDLVNILTEREIRDVKDTIKLIESGELKTHLIDSVVDGVPRFYHLLFAEYFGIEALSDLLKRVKDQNVENINLDSLWNLMVNAVLCASSASLRNVFEYKLQYDPELADVAANDNCKKILFKLLLKSDEARKARESDANNALNIAVNEGLTNITSLLVNCVQSNINDEKLHKLLTILKCGASILEVTDTSRSILSDDALNCIKNIDSIPLTSVLDSNVFRTSQENIKRIIVGVGSEIAEGLIKTSGNNENLVLLLEQFPYHFPEFVRQMTKK